MRIRWSISERWETKDIVLIMEAVKYAVNFYDLVDPKSTTVIKLISNDPSGQSATACRLKNRRYEVRLNYSLLPTTELTLKAVFHEMTHIKQYVNGELRIKAGIHYWNDIASVTEDYWFRPWEMESRAMEEPLYNKFMEEN